MADYVLARFRPDETDILDRVIRFGAESVFDYTRDDFNRVMSEVNSFDISEPKQA